VGYVLVFHHFEADSRTDDGSGRCMLTHTKQKESALRRARNKQANKLDWEGDMTQQKHRVQMPLSETPEDVAMAASLQVSSAEAKTIDIVLEGSGATYDEEAHLCWKPLPREANQVSSALASVSPNLDDQTLHGRLAARACLGKSRRRSAPPTLWEASI
jgi:hypothetical protein